MSADDLCDAWVTQFQQAVTQGSIEIHSRIEDIHQNKFEEEPGKSYIFEGLNIEKIIKAVICQPSAIRGTKTVQDDNYRYVIEGDFSHVIGVTPEDSNGARLQSNRIQITIGEPSDRRLNSQITVFSLKLLRQQDPIKIKVIVPTIA